MLGEYLYNAQFICITTAAEVISEGNFPNVASVFCIRKWKRQPHSNAHTVRKKKKRIL